MYFSDQLQAFCKGECKSNNYIKFTLQNSGDGLDKTFKKLVIAKQLLIDEYNVAIATIKHLLKSNTTDDEQHEINLLAHKWNINLPDIKK